MTLDELIAALQDLRAKGADGSEDVRLEVDSSDPDVLIHYLRHVGLSPNGFVDLEDT